MRRKFLFLVAGIALSGCVSVGHKLDMSKTDQLKPGVSSSADAIALFGAPTSEGTNADGSKLLIWKWVHGSAFGAQAQNLQIVFDEDGKMLRVAHKGAAGT